MGWGRFGSTKIYCIVLSSSAFMGFVVGTRMGTDEFNHSTKSKHHKYLSLKYWFPNLVSYTIFVHEALSRLGLEKGTT
jgi:hypothetical protein